MEASRAGIIGYSRVLRIQDFSSTGFCQLHQEASLSWSNGSFNSYHLWWLFFKYQFDCATRYPDILVKHYSEYVWEGGFEKD